MMLANMFPVIMLPKIYISGDRRTLRVAVGRVDSFMVGFFLTGLIALPGYFVYPKIMLKVFFWVCFCFGFFFFLVLRKDICRRFPFAEFYSPENQGHIEFSLVIRGRDRPCLPLAMGQLV